MNGKTRDCGSNNCSTIVGWRLIQFPSFVGKSQGMVNEDEMIPLSYLSLSAHKNVILSCSWRPFRSNNNPYPFVHLNRRRTHLAPVITIYCTYTNPSLIHNPPIVARYCTGTKENSPSWGRALQGSDHTNTE